MFNRAAEALSEAQREMAGSLAEAGGDGAVSQTAAMAAAAGFICIGAGLTPPDAIS